MRMSGFIIGGILGMAAALYASRKRPGMTAWAVDAAGDIMSSTKKRLFGKVMERKLNQWSKEAGQAVPKRQDASAGNSAEAWQQIGALVESDPELKRETEAILHSATDGSSLPTNASVKHH
ncbi:hypothetical protein [Paenibacillus xylaniclasticus]|uniref:hypothetical protein n=1 Tax=Paenibacillus xylaniclasticus TaxID=588083 RepID=UPI000FD6FDBF|nr:MULTISPECIES: hypothetical protein [Paenibacillus]GFN30614.1 hypothetical protein PCURB6_08740 [Paenibacillus curdlanolyticus]